MKQKFLILANSIIYDKKLMIIEEDFTNSELNDDDIIYALCDTCMELDQQQMNTLILTPGDVDKLLTHLQTNN